MYGDCINYAVLSGHSGTILDLNWLQGDKIASASVDRTGGIFDTVTLKRIKKMKHDGIVNSITTHDSLIATVSDDSLCKVWDSRKKLPIYIYDHGFPLTACTMTQDRVIVGGVDNCGVVIDLRKSEVEMQLFGHMDTISGLACQDDYLVSASMDSTVRVWNLKPSLEKRLIASFDVAQGYEKNLIKPAIKDDLVACGSADRTVNIINYRNNQFQKLHGHKGCVNQVDFHPTDSVIVSASSDGQLFLGEY